MRTMSSASQLSVSTQPSYSFTTSDFKSKNQSGLVDFDFDRLALYSGYTSTLKLSGPPKAMT